LKLHPVLIAAGLLGLGIDALLDEYDDWTSVSCLAVFLMGRRDA
jgi:hypothetical protein